MPKIDNESILPDSIQKRKQLIGAKPSTNGHHSGDTSPSPEKKTQTGNGTAEEPTSSGNSFNDLILSMPPPVLGRDAYYGLIGDFLQSVGPLTEATDACILAHLIPAIGTVIGPDFHVWGGDKQPTRFNTAIVGPSATGRKGTGFVPVRDLMMKTVPDFWKDQPATGLSSGEGLIVRVADKIIKDDQGNETNDLC